MICKIVYKSTKSFRHIIKYCEKILRFSKQSIAAKHPDHIFSTSSKWPKVFNKEAFKIKEMLESNSITIHHVGSTSVPGLLAKPVRENELLTVLRQIKGVQAALPEIAVGSTQGNMDSIANSLINTRAIMEEAQGFGKEVMAETLRELAARYQEQLAAVAREIERRDFSGLKQAAHRLAGTFANAFAPGLQKIARRIEEAATTETMAEVRAAYAELLRAATGFPEQLAEVIQTIINSI